MEKVKSFLDKAIKAIGKALLALVLVVMLGIMSIWTIGLVYVGFNGSCTLEDNQVVCDIRGK